MIWHFLCIKFPKILIWKLYICLHISYMSVESEPKNLIKFMFSWGAFVETFQTVLNQKWSIWHLLQPLLYTSSSTYIYTYDDLYIFFLKNITKKDYLYERKKNRKRPKVWTIFMMGFVVGEIKMLIQDDQKIL